MNESLATMYGVAVTTDATTGEPMVSLRLHVGTERKRFRLSVSRAEALGDELVAHAKAAAKVYTPK
jgi:hypothetical protein